LRTRPNLRRSLTTAGSIIRRAGRFFVGGIDFNTARELPTNLRLPEPRYGQGPVEPADSLRLRVEIHVDVVGNLDERNTFVHPLIAA
jgi:hypothetical protein